MGGMALPSSPDSKANTSGVFQTAPRSILIADHDASSRCLLTEALSARYRIHEAADGPQAARLIRTMRTPAAILCEVDLPMLGGVALVNLVRRHRRFEGVPIVFLSERSSSEDISRGLFAGARRYIVKPFLPDAVLRIVTGLVEPSRDEPVQRQAVR
jgi:two-component system chemotaxis response regulator CheY